MDVNRKELSAIKEVLKESPRGMTVTEISRSVKMNRHSVAKYLEVLVAAGHVDMKTFGPSKVYFLSQRVPVSAMLSFSSDLIFMLDKDLRVRNLNDKFLEYVRLKREDILNKNIENFAFSRMTEPPLLPCIKEALNGAERTVDAYYHSDNRDYYLIVKFLPTVFEDGEKGVTIIASDYTERKLIEETVRNSERKFRNMLEQSTDGITLCDENGVMIECNESMARLTGLPRKGLIGKHVWETPYYIKGYEQIPDRSPQSLKDYVYRFLKTGKSPLTDRFNIFKIERPDGTTSIVQANIFPIKTEKGFMLASIVRDITDMKKAEAAIHESEEKFRNLAETTTSGILIIQDDHIVYANRGIETITGYSPEELSKVSMGFFVHPDYIEIIEAAKLGIKKHHGTYKKIFEIKIITKDGRARWINITMGMMKLNGRPAILKTFFDITERKEAEEALLKERCELEVRVKERTAELEKLNESLMAEVDKRIASESALRDSEERYRRLVEDINDIVWEKDKDGRYTYLSPKMQDVLGYAPEEQLGKTLLEFMPAEEAEKVFQAYRDMIEKHSEYDFPELHMRNKRGEEVILESMGSPCFDKDGNFQGYRGVARDITERTRAKNALQESEERLRLCSAIARFGTFDWDIVNDRHVWSPETYEIYGVPPDTPLNWEYIKSFIYPEDRQDEVFAKLMDPGESEKFSMEYRIRRASDGEVRWVYRNSRIFFEGEGAERRAVRLLGVIQDITERKRVEEQLKVARFTLERSLKFTEALLSAMPIPVFYKDRELRYLGCNKAFSDLMGVTSEEINGKLTGELWPGEHASMYTSKDLELINHPVRQIYEYKVRDKDGVNRPVIYIKNVFRDENDQIAGIVGAFVDITERKRAEEALKASEEKFRNLVERINDVAWEKDANGRFVYLSPKIRDVMGYEPGELIGKTILDFMHPADANAIREDFFRTLREPMAYGLREMSVLHKDGHEVFVEANGIPVYDDRGNFQGYRGVTRDITARKRAEEALHKIEDKYRTLVENINDIAWEMDEDGRFTYISPKVRDIIGYGPEQYIGKAVTDYMPPEDITGFIGTFRSIMANPRPYGLANARLYHKDGHILHLEANATPFYDKKGEFCGYRGVSRDITKRKHMEEMLELMKCSIDHSEDAAFWVKPDTGIYYVNEAACRMLGYSREELLTMSATDIDININREDWREHWEMIKRQKYYKKETLLRTKEGDTFLVEITDNYLEFNGREYDFAIVRPISPPRHRAARQLVTDVQKNKE